MNFTNMKKRIVLVLAVALFVMPMALIHAQSVSYPNSQTQNPSLDGSLYPDNSAANSYNNTPNNLYTGTVAPQPTPTPNTSIPSASGAANLPPATNIGSSNTQSGGNTTSGPVFTLSNPLHGVNSVSDLIFIFMKILSYLAVIFGVIMLMWVGLQFVLARGNPEEIKKRSNQLLWIIVGIGVILGARILISVVINTLQATGTVNSSIIQNAQNAINSQ
jgi:hypothetical protein